MADLSKFKGRAFMKPDQVDALLAEMPEHGDVLELGTGHGVTVAYWAMHRPGVTFLTIDAFKAAVGTGPGTIEDWLVNRQPNQYLFVGTAIEFMRYGFTIAFNLAFIDGSHSHEDCLSDLEIIGHLVDSGGRMLVHDYGRMDVAQLRGVTKAVDDFCRENGWHKTGDVGNTAILERR